MFNSEEELLLFGCKFNDEEEEGTVTWEMPWVLSISFRRLPGLALLLLAENFLSSHIFRFLEGENNTESLVSDNQESEDESSSALG